jgi:hypothetical protein
LEANTLLGKGLAEDWQIERAWCETTVSQFAIIPAQVRSRLLDFLLELRESLGNPKTESNLKAEASTIDASGLFQHAVFGPNATTTVIVGTGNVQHLQSINPAGDLNALSEALKGVGVPYDEIVNLQQAINEDIENGGNPSFEGKTGHWYTGLLARAAKGGLKVGVDVLTGAVGKALAAYLRVS